MSAYTRLQLKSFLWDTRLPPLPPARAFSTAPYGTSFLKGPSENEPELTRSGGLLCV